MKKVKIAIASLFLGTLIYGCSGDSYDEVSKGVNNISVEKSNADGGNTSDEPPQGP